MLNLNLNHRSVQYTPKPMEIGAFAVNLTLKLTENTDTWSYISAPVSSSPWTNHAILVNYTFFFEMIVLFYNVYKQQLCCYINPLMKWKCVHTAQRVHVDGCVCLQYNAYNRPKCTLATLCFLVHFFAVVCMHVLFNIDHLAMLYECVCVSNINILYFWNCFTFKMQLTLRESLTILLLLLLMLLFTSLVFLYCFSIPS